MKNIEQLTQGSKHSFFLSLMSQNPTDLRLDLIRVTYHLALYVTCFPFFNKYVESRGRILIHLLVYMKMITHIEQIKR